MILKVQTIITTILEVWRSKGYFRWTIIYFIDQRVLISLSYFLYSSKHHSTPITPSLVILKSILYFWENSFLYPCFLNSSTDKTSPNSKSFSSLYQNLREWWSTCCSSHQTLASEDYEMRRQKASDLLQAIIPPGCCSCSVCLYWKGIFSSMHLFNKHLTFFEVDVLTPGRILQAAIANP